MATNVRVELKTYHGSNRYDRERACLSLIRQFKRAVNEAGVLHTLKEKEFYEKPGEKKRRKRRHAELQRKYAMQNGDDNNFRRQYKDRRGYDD